MATLRVLVVGVAALALGACRAEAPAPGEPRVEASASSLPVETPTTEPERLGAEAGEGGPVTESGGRNPAPAPRFGGGPEVDASPLGLLGPVFPSLAGESHSSHCDPFEDSSEICL
jgi:hypothetical protein